MAKNLVRISALLLQRILKGYEGISQSQANKRMLVVASENITHNQYMGNNRSMLVSNCLFRVGGAAVLLSNRQTPFHPLVPQPQYLEYVFLLIPLHVYHFLCILKRYLNLEVLHACNCRASDRAAAKYELIHSVRTHIGGDDDCFNAIRQTTGAQLWNSFPCSG